MLYKNSVRVFFSNISLIWKTLIFFIITLGISLGITYVCAIPIIKLLSENGIFEQGTNIINSFFTHLSFTDLLLNLTNLVNLFFSTIINNINSIIVNVVFFCICLVFLPSLLTGMYDFICGGVLNDSMSNNSHLGFCNSFAINFKKNVKYQLAKLTVILPYNVLMYFVLVMTCRLYFLGGVVRIFLPFIFILVYVILAAMRSTVFCGWLSCYLMGTKNVYASLVDSIKVGRRRFVNVFATAIVVFLTLITLNVLAFVCTFGVGEIIMLPASFVFICVFHMVSYYTSKGNRFYTDKQTIFEPIKMEMTDDIHDIKYII